MRMNEDEIILRKVTLTDELLENARLACVGGKSYVRAPADRKARIFDDQLVGQVGNLIGAQWLLGEKKGLQAYREVRAIANANPTKGDGGVDLPGFRIDFKTSMYRYPHIEPVDYNLLVRPHERHDGWAYIQLLVDPEFTAAMIMCWLDDSDLPPVRKGGTFDGAHVKRIGDCPGPATLSLDGYTAP